jgi:hypothetical protein
MLGCMAINADLYVFYEKGELLKIQSSVEVKGTFFNNADSVCDLLSSTNDLIPEITKVYSTGTLNNFTKVELQMRTNVLDRLIDRGTAGEHKGWCHIELIDATRINEMSYDLKQIYQTLVLYAERNNFR